MYTVYILRTDRNTLYVGQTKDLITRLREHALKGYRSAKYMRSFRTFTLVYSETKRSRSAALKKEAELKKLTHAQKEALISRFDPSRTK